MNTKLIERGVKFIAEHSKVIVIAILSAGCWMYDRTKQYHEGKVKGEKSGFEKASKVWAIKLQNLEDKYKRTAKTIENLNNLQRDYIKYKENSLNESERQLCDRRIKELQKKIEDLMKQK